MCARNQKELFFLLLFSSDLQRYLPIEILSVRGWNLLQSWLLIKHNLKVDLSWKHFSSPTRDSDCFPRGVLGVSEGVSVRESVFEGRVWPPVDLRQDRKLHKWYSIKCPSWPTQSKTGELYLKQVVMKMASYQNCSWGWWWVREVRRWTCTTLTQTASAHQIQRLMVCVYVLFK